MKLAPIALFVYNRPVHTRRTVEALLKNELAEGERSVYFFRCAEETRGRGCGARGAGIHQDDHRFQFSQHC